MDRLSPSFSLDSSLGRLARWLRLLGHDAAWQRGDTLQQAHFRARAEGRVLLTRSNDLARLGLSTPPAGCMRLATDRLVDQLVEIARRWPIFREAAPFSRCSLCNVPLDPLDPARAREVVPPYVARTQAAFVICPQCRKIFWSATHASEIMQVFQQAASLAAQPLPDEKEQRGAGSGTSDPAPLEE